MYALDFGTTKARYELSFSAAMQRKHRLLNGTSSLTPWLTASKLKPIMDILNTEDPQENLKNLMDEFGQASRNQHP
jgi:hypothetical protein